MADYFKTEIFKLADPFQFKLRFYTANFYPKKTTGTENCGVPAGKTFTFYGKGLLELQVL